MADRAPTTVPAGGASRFEFAPPRRFVLPAVLLLLSERPSYGYNLEKDLLAFNVGRIDRPTVYRALADLEADGLVTSWSEAPSAGQARRVYGVTPLGERVLRVWMHVIKRERDSLGNVLRRYQATGTIDAVLAEVDGGWAAALGFGWSPVSTTSVAPRRFNTVDGDWRYITPESALQAVASSEESRGETVEDDQPENYVDGCIPAGPASAGADIVAVEGLRHFRLTPDRSVVLIDVRSTVGPISFGADGLTGSIAADITDGAIRPRSHPSAHVEIAVDGLRSGNRVYDAELLRRIDARRFPTATLDLGRCLAVGSTGRYRVAGELTFHGVTRPTEGTVDIAVAADGRLVVTGEQVFDIRDFAVPSPTVLMLRIYPDARVHLHVEAKPEVT
jgi:PadR family transcriptional regulator PadR